MLNYKESVKDIVEELSTTMAAINEKEVETVAQLIQDANQVFFVGVGRVKLSLESVAKRLAHLGVKAYVVGQITEPAIQKGDLLIVGSGSGESMFPLGIAKKAKSLGVTVIHIGSSTESSMSTVADYFIHIPVNNKMKSEGIISKQPMTSLFEQSLLLLGDTIAYMIVKDKNIELNTLWEYHANLE